MQKDTTMLHQMLQLFGVNKIKFNNFTFQHRYNGVQCDLEAWDHEGDKIEDTDDLQEEIAELLRDEITQNNLLYQDIMDLFPVGIKLLDYDESDICEELAMLDFEVEIGTDS